MNTIVEEIANYQDQDQEVAKNFPTSMEPIQQNILNHIIGNNDNKYMGFYFFYYTGAKIYFNLNLNVDVTT